LARLVSGAGLAVLMAGLAAHARPAVAASAEPVALDEAARRLAAGGWILMMRHAATEPGVGDPPAFRLGDCATQRNLSTAGREQARQAGVTMRAAGIRIDQVRTSQWCRCRETAELAFGKATDWPALNSFFASRGSESAQSDQVHAWAATLGAGRNAMLVTHQVNISAVMGQFAAPGEVVVGRWRDGRIEPAFRFVP
jgi:phosphohistidine phosphatase SixA